ncbi:MAG: hypothetical protein ACHQ1D_01615 [Nitrososphaerales archaeon]|jgi:hypothetical protein
MDKTKIDDYYVRLANKYHKSGLDWSDAWGLSRDEYYQDREPIGAGTGVTQKYNDKSKWDRGILHIPSEEGGLGLTWNPNKQYGRR